MKRNTLFKNLAVSALLTSGLNLQAATATYYAENVTLGEYTSFDLDSSYGLLSVLKSQSASSASWSMNFDFENSQVTYVNFHAEMTNIHLTQTASFATGFGQPLKQVTLDVLLNVTLSAAFNPVTVNISPGLGGFDVADTGPLSPTSTINFFGSYTLTGPSSSKSGVFDVESINNPIYMNQFQGGKLTATGSAPLYDLVFTQFSYVFQGKANTQSFLVNDIVDGVAITLGSTAPDNTGYGFYGQNVSIDLSTTPTAIPEPSSLSLLAGALALGAYTTKRRRAA